MAKGRQLDLNWSNTRGLAMANLSPLMRRNFLEYASYVIVDRAIPELADGCKPVQRRILHTLHEIDDGKFHKVANVIGETMKLHPHGDASIGDALVVLANKEYFIEKQGNFGNLITGHRAAAARYIECRLTELAKETLFSKAVTEYRPSYDGRREEPVTLPAKLPVLLMLGTEGIAVGMSTRILPHNLPELWQAQIDLLLGHKVQCFPDFPHGGLMDISDYDDGRGRVRVRARLETPDSKRITITEIPYGTTTESLIASIENAAQKGQIKISSIDDFTADAVEIQIQLARGAQADEVIPRLFAYTDCEVNLTSNIVAIDSRRPLLLGVSEILERLTRSLKSTLKSELQHELKLLEDKHHWLTLEQIFVEKAVYKRIEKAKTDSKVRGEVKLGMKQHVKLFVRPMVDEDITRLLGLPIRRISAFDIAKHREDVGDVLAAIKRVRGKLRNMNKTTVKYLEALLDKYDDTYPRRTEITTFKEIDKKAVARQNLKATYDPKTGFFGTQVKGSEYVITVSEYDRILTVSDDGSYRIMVAPKKQLLSGKLVRCELFDPEVGLHCIVVYRDKKRIAYAKKVHIHKFIKNKEYHLIKDKAGKLDLLLPADQQGVVQLKFAPMKRQRVKEASFDLAELEPTGVTARGVRLAAKPVKKILLSSDN